MKKISVIVPVYNTEKYLKRCLTSITNQSLKEIEILIINDGSTDNSDEIIEEFQKKDLRIKVINKKNGGLASARNIGIDISEGEYILHIDSDDWVEENYLQDIYNYAIQKKLDIVVTDFYRDFDNGKLEYVQDLNLDFGTIISGNEYLERFISGFSYPCVWNKLFKSNLYKNTKIRHPQNISLGEDIGTTPFLIESSKKIGKLNKAYVHYIQNPQSITKSGKLKKIDELFFVLKNIEEKLVNKVDKEALDGLFINNLGNIFYTEKTLIKNRKDVLNFLEKIKNTKKIKTKSKKNLFFFLILKCFPSFYTVCFLRKINLFFLKLKKI